MLQFKRHRLVWLGNPGKHLRISANQPTWRCGDSQASSRTRRFAGARTGQACKPRDLTPELRRRVRTSCHDRVLRRAKRKCPAHRSTPARVNGDWSRDYLASEREHISKIEAGVEYAGLYGVRAKKTGPTMCRAPCRRSLCRLLSSSSCTRPRETVTAVRWRALSR